MQKRHAQNDSTAFGGYPRNVVNSSVLMERQNDCGNERRCVAPVQETARQRVAGTTCGRHSVGRSVTPSDGHGRRPRPKSGGGQNRKIIGSKNLVFLNLQKRPKSKFWGFYFFICPAIYSTGQI